MTVAVHGERESGGELNMALARCFLCDSDSLTTTVGGVDDLMSIPLATWTEAGLTGRKTICTKCLRERLGRKLDLNKDFNRALHLWPRLRPQE
jgi:hypothetical protein